MASPHAYVIATGRVGLGPSFASTGFELDFDLGGPRGTVLATASTQGASGFMQMSYDPVVLFLKLYARAWFGKISKKIWDKELWSGMQGPILSLVSPSAHP